MYVNSNFSHENFPHKEKKRKKLEIKLEMSNVKISKI